MSMNCIIIFMKIRFTAPTHSTWQGHIKLDRAFQAESYRMNIKVSKYNLANSEEIWVAGKREEERTTMFSGGKLIVEGESMAGALEEY